MAGEQSDAFPDELREWVERRAAEHDADPGTLLARAVSVYRYLDAEADPDADGAPIDVDLERLDGMEERIEVLSDRVGDVEDDLDTKIDDVRDRVIQVKREADAKAPRDHDHPELADRVDAAAHAAEDAAAQVDALSDRLDRGFENYEEILEYLTDTTGDLEDTVADLRTELRHLSAAETDRRAVDELRTTANRHGDRTAACGDCGSTVDVGLLSRPRCPHCEATYVDFEPSSGFFGSATLATGEHPALTDGEDGGDETEFGGTTDG
ncbi:hypothetical protein [Haloplanus salilacus]|uniref:hypothetical protein n=1 Tax=Haloplanus salilacus TaxID=2949994 RepID=UPI0030CDEDE0